MQAAVAPRKHGTHGQVNTDQIFTLPVSIKSWGYSRAGHTRGKSLIRIRE